MTLPTIWYWVCMFGMAICAWIDYHTRLIPNRITYPLIVGTFLLSLWFGVALSALWGGIALGAIFFVPRLLAGAKSAGMGDVKLAFLGGLLLGVEAGLYALLITSLIALVVLTPLLFARKMGWKDAIPFGPFLAAGFIAVIGSSML